MDDVIERMAAALSEPYVFTGPNAAEMKELQQTTMEHEIRHALRAVSDTHRLVPAKFVWDDPAFDPIIELGDYHPGRCSRAWDEFIAALPDYTEAADG